LYFVL